MVPAPDPASFFSGIEPHARERGEGTRTGAVRSLYRIGEAAAKGVSAERAVFVLIEREGTPFTAIHRDRLWKLFQTPVYAMLTGSDGSIAGFECEVQDGFHLPGKPAPEAETVCECGRPGLLARLNCGAAGE